MTADWHDALRELIPDGQLPEPEPVAPEVPRQTAPLEIFVERKGRGGKVATIVCGFTLPDDAVADVASQLKRRLGAGGSARGGEILIQGERAQAVATALRDMGYKVKNSNFSSNSSFLR